MTRARQPGEASIYDPCVDRERLGSQTGRLHDFDTTIIDAIMKNLRAKHPTRSLQVFDAGCADGSMIHSRFKHRHGCQVEGADKSATAISRAQTIAAGDPRFTFHQLDLSEAELPKDRYDLVTCFYVLPHVADPALFVRQLWASVAPGGYLVLRSGDDGWKVVHPPPDGWQTMLDLSERHFPMSDRQNGRKIRGYLEQVSPPPHAVIPHFWTESTVGLTASGFESFFETYYGFRKNYLAAGKSSADPETLRRIACLLATAKEHFIKQQPFASVTHATFAAEKPC